MSEGPTDAVAPIAGPEASSGRGTAPPETAPARRRFRLNNLRRWAPTTGVLLVAFAVLAALMYGGYLAWDRIDSTPETEGTIFVETPQVYTRERLVNDRFVQESWLRNELEGKITLAPSQTVNVTREERTTLRTAPGGSETPPATATPAPDKGGDQAGSARAPSVSPSDDFLIRNAHRELIR